MLYRYYMGRGKDTRGIKPKESKRDKYVPEICFVETIPSIESGIQKTYGSIQFNLFSLFASYPSLVSRRRLTSLVVHYFRRIPSALCRVIRLCL